LAVSGRPVDQGAGHKPRHIAKAVGYYSLDRSVWA
jgi:hypothetical protein